MPDKHRGGYSDPPLPTNTVEREVMVSDAESYLAEVSGASDARQMKFDAQWFAGQLVQAHKLSRKEHVEKVLAAYASYVLVMMEDRYKQSMLDAAEQLGINAAKTKSPLGLLIELNLSYGSGSDADRRRATKSISRDKRAIEYLMRRGVTPTKALALWDQPGEGLDTWVRRPTRARAATANDAHEERPVASAEPDTPDANVAPNADQGGEPSLKDASLMAWFETKNYPPRPTLAGTMTRGATRTLTLSQNHGDKVIPELQLTIPRGRLFYLVQLVFNELTEETERLQAERLEEMQRRQRARQQRATRMSRTERKPSD